MQLPSFEPERYEIRLENLASRSVLHSEQAVVQSIIVNGKTTSQFQSFRATLPMPADLKGVFLQVFDTKTRETVTNQALHQANLSTEIQ